MPGARQILPGTSIAASALSDSDVQVYFQDRFGVIREFRRSSTRWSGGDLSSAIHEVKPKSPIAIRERHVSEGRQLLVFSFTDHSFLQETYSHTGELSVWNEGDLTNKAIQAAPFSKFASTAYLDSDWICVFYQTPDRSIEERIGGWGTGLLRAETKDTPPPRAGTGITAVGWKKGGGLSTRVYVQAEDNYIWEYAWEKDTHWSAKELPFQAKAGSPLASASWKDTDGVHLRVFYLDSEDRVQASVFENERWTGTCEELGKNQPRAASYSQLAAVAASGGVSLFYQPFGEDSIKEHRYVPGQGWSAGATLAPRRHNPQAIDFGGETFAVGLLPWIENVAIADWKSYNPAEIDGVGILIGYQDGHLVGEDLKKKEPYLIEPDAGAPPARYTWIYTPGGSIIYRLAEGNGDRDVKGHHEVRTGKAIICAGEFEVSRPGRINSVTLLTTDHCGHGKPAESRSLGAVAAKLESLGIATDYITWFWKA